MKLYERVLYRSLFPSIKCLFFYLNFKYSFNFRTR